MAWSLPTFLTFFPSLPTTVIPSGLQRRLISYLLRRFLGSLLRDGGKRLEEEAGLLEVDVTRKIEVKQLVADPEALNTLIGRRSPLCITEASLGSFTLSIDWPTTTWSTAVCSPLASVPDVCIGLTDFRVVGTPSEGSPSSFGTSTADLESSVMQLAEGFVRTAMQPAEHVGLEHSMRAVENELSVNLGDLPGIPGDFARASASTSASESSTKQEAGFLAGLVERILAKVQLSVKGVTFELQSDSSCLRFDIARLESSTHPDASSAALSRRISVSSPVIWLGPLPQKPLNLGSTYESDSSLSSLDSQDDLAMSQAIADLRRSQFDDPASSAAGGQSSAHEMFWSFREDATKSGLRSQITSSAEKVPRTWRPIFDFGEQDCICDLTLGRQGPDSLPRVAVHCAISTPRLLLYKDDIEALVALLSSFPDHKSVEDDVPIPEGRLHTDKPDISLSVEGVEAAVSILPATDQEEATSVDIARTSVRHALKLWVGRITAADNASGRNAAVATLQLEELMPNGNANPIIQFDTCRPEDAAARASWQDGLVEVKLAACTIILDPDIIARARPFLETTLGESESTTPSDENATERAGPTSRRAKQTPSSLQVSVTCPSLDVSLPAWATVCKRSGGLSCHAANVELCWNGHQANLACAALSARLGHPQPLLQLYPSRDMEPPQDVAVRLTLGSPRSTPFVETRFAGQPTSQSPSTSLQLARLDITLAKHDFDALQYLADDVTNWLEQLAFLSPSSANSPALPPMPHQPDVSKTSQTPPHFAVNVVLARICLQLDEGTVLALDLSSVNGNVTSLPPGQAGFVVKIQDVNVSVEQRGKRTRILSRLTPHSNTPQISIESLTSMTPKKKACISLALQEIFVSVAPDLSWIASAAKFFCAPPGVFEGVEPNDITILEVCARCLVIQVEPPDTTSCLRVHCEQLSARYCLPRRAERHRVQVAGTTLVQFCDDATLPDDTSTVSPEIFRHSVKLKAHSGKQTPEMATILRLGEFEVAVRSGSTPDEGPIKVTLQRGTLWMGLCADTLSAVSASLPHLAEIDFGFPPPPPKAPPSPERDPAAGFERTTDSILYMMQSALEDAGRVAPALGDFPEDLGNEDYPASLDYVSPRQNPRAKTRQNLSSEYVVVHSLHPGGLQIIDEFSMSSSSDSTSRSSVQTLIRVEHLDVHIELYDGFDWAVTRRTIQEGRRSVRKRLQKIRQLLAEGVPAEGLAEDTSQTLFNSVHLGLSGSAKQLNAAQLMASIDDELRDKDGPHDTENDDSLTTSWESLHAQAKPSSTMKPRNVHREVLMRAHQPALSFQLDGIAGCTKLFRPSCHRIVDVNLRVETVSILDHIKTSTWNMFLTEMRPSEGGDLRPTDEPMARAKFSLVKPPNSTRTREALLKIKLAPVRLYVDQDAVDYLKAFGGFQPTKGAGEGDPEPAAEGSEELFFQRVEISPVRIKLDYKPKRFDYRALRAGKTAELMNFFHFEGSDMTLRHAVLTGVSSPARVGELLQDIWTPDVKANQLADVVSGIAPVRSVVNVGSGIADLVLLPIEQVRKDGRLARGLQKGTNAFAKSTALEAIKLGARLATGTQVILERAESMLGARLASDIHAEAIDVLAGQGDANDGEELASEQISRYANQPGGAREGVKVAYQTLSQNMRTTAQTILAVPLEVFNEGSGRAVVKAVPIALLHPAVGATGAISKTLLGLRHSLDPAAAVLDADKYKSGPRPS